MIKFQLRIKVDLQVQSHCQDMYLNHVSNVDSFADITGAGKTESQAAKRRCQTIQEMIKINTTIYSCLLFIFFYKIYKGSTFYHVFIKIDRTSHKK